MNEIWVEVKFDFERVNDLKLEVSNMGRFRSFNRINKGGKILKGSVTNGYKSISIKFFNERDEKSEQKIVYLRKQIRILNDALIKDKDRVNNKTLNNDERNTLINRIKESDVLLTSLKQTLAKETKKSDKKRSFYWSALQHRIVAEYFCKKPSEQHNLVIHLNYDKHDNRAENLKWVNQDESTAHQLKSPFVIEEKKHRKENPEGLKRNTKLTASEVSIIKKRINEEKLLSHLAKQFGVSQTQLMRIKRGQNWGEVPPAG